MVWLSLVGFRGFFAAWLTSGRHPVSDYTPTTAQFFSWLGDIATAGDVASVRRWLAEVERAAAEKAWGEGERAGMSNLVRAQLGQPSAQSVNPYRKGLSDE